MKLCSEWSEGAQVIIHSILYDRTVDCLSHNNMKSNVDGISIYYYAKIKSLFSMKASLGNIIYVTSLVPLPSAYRYYEAKSL